MFPNLCHRAAFVSVTKHALQNAASAKCSGEVHAIERSVGAMLLM
jgi:hypothetical protein